MSNFFSEAGYAPSAAEELSIGREVVADLHAEAKRKASELSERLARAQVGARLSRTVDLLESRLGESPADIRIGLLLPSLHSLEADYRAYDTEEGRKELTPDLFAMIDDAATAVRDLVGIFPVARTIEAGRIAQRLPTCDLGLTVADGEKAVSAAQASPLVMIAAIEALSASLPAIAEPEDGSVNIRQAEIAAISDQVRMLSRSMHEYKDELRSYADWARSF
jgi:hypothetical protein